MGYRRFAMLVACVVSLTLTAPLWGQQYYGSLTGTITDSTGAVVPNAAVSVTDLSKGTVTKTTSNGAGIYRAGNLTPDPYRIEVELAGFKKAVLEPINIDFNTTSTVDIKLEVGSNLETVSVTGAAPALQVESGKSTATIEGSLVNKLPLYTGDRADERNLVYSLPFSAYGYFSRMGINGARSSQVRFDADGILNRGTTNDGQQQQHSINYEAIQEVKYGLVNSGAESQTEAQFTIVTKGGSNDFHGAIYLDTHHSVFDAGAHSLPKGAKKPFARHNYEGLTLSGPVYIPKFYNGRNHTFWTVSYEWNQSPSRSDSFVTSPTPAMRTGNFSQLVDSSGKLIPIKDPVSGLPFNGNVIPLNRVYPGAKPYLDKFYPLPNIQTAIFFNNTFVPSNVVTHTVTHRADIRIDQVVSSKNNFFFRVNRYTNPDSSYALFYGTGKNISHFTLDTYQFTDTHTFLPTLLNEFRFGTRGTYNTQRVGVTAQSLIDLLGIQGILPILYANGITGIPSIGITGLGGISQYSHLDNGPRIWDIYDNVKWVRGRHTLTFGANPRKDAFYNLSYDKPGQFSFTGFFSGYGLADFMLGIPFNSTRSYPRAALGPTQLEGWYLGAYVQDDMKVSPRLTVNFGVRWDTNFAGQETHGLYYNLDPVNGNLIVPSQDAINKVVASFPTAVKFVTAAQAGYPDRLRNTQLGDFGPRLGLAWRPFGEKFVVRSAYGIYTDNLSLGYINSAGAPWGGSETFVNQLTNGQLLWAWPAAFPAGVVGQRPGTVGVSGINPNLRNPYAQQWNLTLERQVEQIVFRIQYIGTKSSELYWLRNVNVPAPSTIPFSVSRRPFQQYAAANYKTNGGNASYNALTIGAERRLGSGITFSSYWTWAKMLTDSYDGTDNPSLDFIPWFPTFDRFKWKGPETNVPRFRWTTVYFAELPFGRGKKLANNLNPVLNYVTEGWALSGVLDIETGWWYSPYYSSGTDPAGIQFNSGSLDRIANGVLSNSGLQPNSFFLTPSAFAMPPDHVGRFGTAGMNFLQEPSFWTYNMAFQRTFPIRERVRFELLAKFEDIFNHGFWYHSSFLGGLDFSNPTTFGKMTGGQSGYRKLQVLLRLAW